MSKKVKTSTNAKMGDGKVVTFVYMTKMEKQDMNIFMKKHTVMLKTDYWRKKLF